MIIFADSVQKAIPAYPEAIQRMRKYLDGAQPDLIRVLARFWKNQQNAVSYAEIRTAILKGQIDKAIIDAWFQDYSGLIADKFLPSWKGAMEAAAQQITEHNGAFTFEFNTPNVREWTVNHAAELVTNVTKEQRAAVNGLIQRATAIQDMGVDALARMIRPTVGLYHAQAVANMNYMLTVRKTLLEANPHMKQSTAIRRAQEAAVKYAEKQHRYRAHMISRTELAFGYNNGERMAIDQAVAENLIRPIKKSWLDAGDVRVCKYCDELNGEEQEMHDEFSIGGVQCPPLHPHCRCVCIYKEKEG